MSDVVGGWIRLIGSAERVSRTVTSRMTGCELPGPQRRVLMDIKENGGTTDRQTGRRLAMNSSQVSKVMALLMENGWVEAAASSTHQSQRYLSLTDDGRGQANMVASLRREAFQEAIGSLEPKERRVLEAAALGLLPGSDPIFKLSVLTPSRIERVLAILLKIAEDLRWNQSGRIYAVRRLTIHFERWSSEWETGWVVADGGQIAGLCLMTPGREFTDTTEDDGHATITMLSVNERYAGLGYGAALLDRCIAQARKATYASLTMYVPSDVLPLMKLLQSRKFRRRAKPETNGEFSRFGPSRGWVNMDLRLDP